jgi:hypothetical protein
VEVRKFVPDFVYNFAVRIAENVEGMSTKNGFYLFPVILNEIDHIKMFSINISFE